MSTDQEKSAKRARKEARRAAKAELAKKESGDQVEGKDEKRKRKRNDPETTSDQVSESSPKIKKSKKEIADDAITFQPEEAAAQFPPFFSFDSLDVDEKIKSSLAAFDKPTLIQAASWPILLAGRDFIGIAKTGSGKTFAFGLPALRHIQSTGISKKNQKVRVLVIAPTRELAMQTHVVMVDLGKPLKINSLCIFGGMPKPAQAQQLREQRPACVIGTPGRILDFANEGVLDLSQVDYLVLDEADRMLDKGFEPDIRAIIAKARPNVDGENKRQTAMFSATWPLSVRALAQDFMSDPIRATVGSDELTANTAVAQSVTVIHDGRQKEAEMIKVLRNNGFGASASKKAVGQVIVFALYKMEASRLHRALLNQGFKAGCIHGNLSQVQRTQALDEFKQSKTNVLVATDVAARGLDLPKVELVLNVTFPLTIEDYVHRIGRTGRAGRQGKSITFFTEDDKAHSGELQRVLKDAGQQVPDELAAFGGTIKKKAHPVYGAHYDESLAGKTGKKITF